MDHTRQTVRKSHKGSRQQKDEVILVQTHLRGAVSVESKLRQLDDYCHLPRGTERSAVVSPEYRADSSLRLWTPWIHSQDSHMKNNWFVFVSSIEGLRWHFLIKACVVKSFFKKVHLAACVQQLLTHHSAYKRSRAFRICPRWWRRSTRPRLLPWCSGPRSWQTDEGGAADPKGRFWSMRLSGWLKRKRKFISIATRSVIFFKYHTNSWLY